VHTSAILPSGQRDESYFPFTSIPAHLSPPRLSFKSEIRSSSDPFKDNESETLIAFT
jgi:hypothetical protein